MRKFKSSIRMGKLCTIEQLMTNLRDNSTRNKLHVTDVLTGRVVVTGSYLELETSVSNEVEKPGFTWVKKPEYITFTGIDARTDLGRAAALAERYPIEWGVLFSESNRDSRYASNQLRDEVLAMKPGRKAAHLCGRYYRNLISKEVECHFDSRNFFRSCHLPCWLKSFEVIQLNGFDNVPYAATLSDYYEGTPIILQTSSKKLFPVSRNPAVRFLCDASGGRGELITSVPPTQEDRMVGYAGGLGPGLMHHVLTKIEGDGKFWLDMETNVRTNGWFDLDKVEQVCKEVYGE